MFVDDDYNDFDKIHSENLVEFLKLNDFGFHASITMGKTLKTYIPPLSLSADSCICVYIWNAEPLNFSHLVCNTETCTFIYILY